MIFQDLLGPGQQKPVGRAPAQICLGKRLFNAGEKFGALQVFGQQQFPGLYAEELSQQCIPAFGICHPELACGDVKGSSSRFFARKALCHSGQKIILPGVKTAVQADEAWCYHPYHLPLYDPLGFPGIFHLFAYGNTLALPDKPGNIGCCRMEGNSAHGNRIFTLLVPGGKGYFQDFGCGYGIFEKHLVKIAHPVKKYAVRVLALDFKILLQHGCLFPGSLPCSL